MDEKQRFQMAAVEWAARGQGVSLGTAEAHALAAGVDSRTVVLVEGTSDQVALEALAERRGRNLDAERISILPIGGATTIGRFLDLFGPQGFDIRLAGLCDAGEEGAFQRGLERAGLGSNLTRADMEALGFYVCVADLEDELIRSSVPPPWNRSSMRMVSLDRSAPSRSSRRSKDGPMRSSFGASWGPAAAGRSSTRACSSTPWISPKCLGRWIVYLPMFDALSEGSG